MKAVGIIAEYNPLHDGHVYHLKEAVRLAGSDAVVVAMSGDYVQRGEPAILDKWERTEMALNNGADVVVEIPTLFCLGNAGQYGSAGVRILEAFNTVSHIAFGSETGDIDILCRIASNMDKDSERINFIVSELIKSGCSYPRARAEAYNKLFPVYSSDCEALSNSNDILAIEYLRSITRLEPIAVKRVGAAYDEKVNDKLVFQSSSGIRSLLSEGKYIRKYVPEDVNLSIQTAINSDLLSNNNKWMQVLKYAILSMTAAEIDECPSGDEGIGNRIRSVISDTDSWDEFVESVKSKRFTHTRLSRLLVQIILGIDRNYYLSDEPQYVRVLGLNGKGCQLVSESVNDSTIPFITNINKQRNLLNEEGLKQLELDIHAADIYNLVTGRNQFELSDYRHKPIILSE